MKPQRQLTRRHITWATLPRLRGRTTVTAIQCCYCHAWVKPRYIRWPAAICRTCERSGLNQTWHPSPEHLARARAHEDNGRRGFDFTNHRSAEQIEGRNNP
jgi:endonuclease/exonuclease/phosphatase (EEP) superfamily protein YafD